MLINLFIVLQAEHFNLKQALNHIFLNFKEPIMIKNESELIFDQIIKECGKLAKIDEKSFEIKDSEQSLK